MYTTELAAAALAAKGLSGHRDLAGQQQAGILRVVRELGRRPVAQVVLFRLPAVS